MMGTVSKCDMAIWASVCFELKGVRKYFFVSVSGRVEHHQAIALLDRLPPKFVIFRGITKEVFYRTYPSNGLLDSKRNNPRVVLQLSHFIWILNKCLQSTCC